MNTEQFVRNSDARLSAVMAAQAEVQAEMERATQTGRERLRALHDEAANIQALLLAMDGLPRETVEALLRDDVPAAEVEPPVAAKVSAETIALIRKAEVPAAGTAPARPRRVKAEPAPPPPVIEPGAKPEARGLTGADAKILIVMRANREADGVCRMSMREIADLAHVHQSSARICIGRIRSAGIIAPTKDDPTIYTVADKGKRLGMEVVEKREAVAAPVAQPAQASQPVATRGPISAGDAAIDAKVMDIIRRADATGNKLHDTSILADKVGISILGIGRSIERLAAAGQIKWSNSFAGHVAIELLASAEVAA